MSYQVLARKWRPRDFTTLVGQEHVVKALTHALEQQRLHHAYLFTGTRGVGKTTLSRILAKSLNCIGPDGNGTVTAQPCGVCRVCTEIDAGRFVDYIEMDAASNRGVDEMAQLLDKAIYAPSSGRFKVYMIDEVHMLTNHAFNAMLKTLEEPPAHVKFILATTDPQKIPVTVLSRCLQFNLKQMPPAQIVGHLEHILQAEQIAFEPTALRLLAQAAQGSMRDGLSLTDQAIAYSAGEVTEAAVRGMLGAIDQSYLIRLLDALAAQDGPGVLAVADEMTGRSLSFAGALQDLASLLHKIALVQAVPEALQDEWPEAQDIVRFAGMFDAQEVQLYYQIANLGRNELALAPDEYAGFTMTLLRMLAFRPLQPGEGSGEGGSRGTSAGGRPASLAVRPASATVAPRPAAAFATPSAAQAAATTPAGGSPAFAPERQPAPRVPAAATTSGAAVSEGDKGAAMAPAPSVQASAASAPASPLSATSRPLSPAMAALAAARQGREGAGGRDASRDSSRSRPPAAAPAPASAAAPYSATLAPVPVAAEASTTALAVREKAPAPHRERAAAPWEDEPDMPPAPPDDLPWLAPGETESTLLGAEKSEAAPGALPATNRHDHPAPAAPAEPDAAMPGIATQHAAIPVVSAEPGNGMAAASASTAASASAAPLPTIAATAAAGLPGGSWIAFARQLPAKGLAQQLAHQSELVSMEAGVWTLRVALAHLAEGPAVERFQALLGEHLEQPVRLAFEIGPVSQTVAIADAEARAAAQEAAEASIHGDPFVQALLRDFDARIVPESIQPRTA
ncbi:DNA polymerase III subunit gamma/tau [Imbroritus primus]|uniref:DNA polymerase III subunit gamma/tau n=1 Tax=Imbroritus primus TaxID=3058603 RepID=A0ACD3SMS2_9BURK|nr:DNA polymerase III subunit gamma/tau [Burkholderiaceae bacterium PBA]